MYPYMFLCLLLLVGLQAAGAVSPCDADPIVLPIKDVQVASNISNSFMKGIAAQVGSPPQDIVLMLWPELNNTWIYDEEAYCDDSIIWNDQICEVRRGNLFQETESDSFEKDNDIVAAGGAGSEANLEGSEVGIKKLVSTSVGGRDTLSINGSSPIEKFPVGIPRLRWDSGYTMLHALGLGSNSTYLNALRSAGLIGSRVWSLFWGRMWIEDGMDGSLVLGGYDQEKVIGKNYTAPLQYDDYSGSGGCWTGMKVIISDIKVNFRDGTDKSIFPSSTALPVCLVPQRQLLLEAPGSYVEKFEQVTKINHTGNSFGLHWSARLFDAEDVFDGDITFHLDSGLEIRIPNDQYIVPFVDIARNGSRTISRTSKELLMNGLGSQPATLGRYFFTSAYLMVNHDAGTFTLWQANPSKKTKLVRVFDKKTASECEDPSGVVQPSASATASAEPNKEPAQDPASGPSGAVIGGAVAGSIVGVGLIGLVGFLFLRRRRKQNLQNAAAIQHAQVGDRKSPGHQPWQQADPAKTYGPSEVYGSLPTRAEVPGQSHFVYEMDAHTFSPTMQKSRQHRQHR